MTKGFEIQKRQKYLKENKPVDSRWNRDWKTYKCMWKRDRHYTWKKDGKI